MKIVAVTACPTGIAHTYMVAEVLKKEATRRGISIKIETQGAMGIENPLSAADIASADLCIIASDIDIEGKARFVGAKTHVLSIEQLLSKADDQLESLFSRL